MDDARPDDDDAARTRRHDERGAAISQPRSTPPGWYADGAGSERWWDGRGWTTYTRPHEIPQNLVPSDTEARRGRRGRGILAAIAFVLALVALLLMGAANRLVPLLGLVVWVPALIAVALGVIALARRARGRGLAIAAIITSVVAVGGAVSTLGQRSAPVPRVDAAHEQQYLDAVLDRVSSDMGASPLTGGARTAAHKKLDKEALDAGYEACREMRNGASADEFAQGVLESIGSSNVSNAQGRKVAKTMVITMGEYLCPQYLDEAQAIADAL